MVHGVLPYTQGMVLRRARTLGSTATSFTAPTVSRSRPPEDDGTATSRVAIPCFSTAKLDGPVHNQLVLYPFGVGNDGTTYDFRVIGWRVVQQSSTFDLWFPMILAAFSCTLSQFVGLAGSPMVATDRAVDTISRTANLGSDLSGEVVSPQNDTPGRIKLDLEGCSYWEPTFDMTGATSGNLLYGYL